jgi:hypothetical protein
VRDGEARYRTAAEFIRSLPSNAVIISNLHSGSVRYYASRLTLRYEWIGDDGEIEAFRRTFQAVADLSWLDKNPLATPAKTVRLFAIAVESDP